MISKTLNADSCREQQPVKLIVRFRCILALPQERMSVSYESPARTPHRKRPYYTARAFFVFDAENDPLYLPFLLAATATN
jgi:hypothetical protein